MEEKCAVVCAKDSLHAVSFFGVVVYVDDPDSKATIRHERREVHLVADMDAGRVTIRTVGRDGKTAILTHSASH